METTQQLKSKGSIQFNMKEFLMKYCLVIAIILMVGILSMATNKFLTVSNMISILRQISIQSIVAIGITMVIILGQMDLSVGSIVAFASVVNALLLKSGVPIGFAILITIAISSLWGLISGFVTAKYNIHSFLVTLAMMTVARGTGYIITGGYPIGGLTDSFFAIGGSHIGSIPISVLYMAAFYCIFIFILNWTPFGRSIYAIGGNTDAARLSGINVSKVKIIVFMMSAALSATAGVILSSRLMSGAPDVGIGWEMDVIAATIIGGTNMFGGEGQLKGTLLGMLFIGILTNGMVLLNFNPYMQDIIKGLVILLAVIINAYQKKK